MVISMFDLDFSYQVFASYLVFIILACIIIILIVSLFNFFYKRSKQKKINNIENKLELIYSEIIKLNEKIDRLYNNDSDDFIE